MNNLLKTLFFCVFTALLSQGPKGEAGVGGRSEMVRQKNTDAIYLFVITAPDQKIYVIRSHPVLNVASFLLLFKMFVSRSTALQGLLDLQDQSALQ